MLKKFFSKHTAPKFVFFFILLLCWSLALVQSAAKQLKQDQAIPAFQNKILPVSDVIPAFQTELSQTLELSGDTAHLTKENVTAYCQSLARQLDSKASLLSFHSDSDYSDLYFYSPVLQEKFQISPATSSGSNLQIVVVWNQDGGCKHIYLGMPCIELSF